MENKIKRIKTMIGEKVYGCVNVELTNTGVIYTIMDRCGYFKYHVTPIVLNKMDEYELSCNIVNCYKKATIKEDI